MRKRSSEICCEGVSIAFSPEVLRSRLIDGDALVGRRFVVLFAAAGFGKTTLARQIARRYESATICDMRDCASLADVVSRIAALTGGPLVLPETARANVSAEALVDFALDRWQRPLAPFVIFENCESLVAIPGAPEALGAVLCGTPEGRSVCICSRAALAIPFLQFSAPDDVMVVNEARLAFSTHELREIFSEVTALPHLYEITRGWPLCVRMIERLTQHRTLAEVLADLTEVDLSMLYSYLLEHVVSRLDSLAYEVMLLIAASGSAHQAELDGLFGKEAQRARALCKNSPFIIEHGDQLILHPLIAQSILQRDAERARNMLLRAASAALSEDGLRAGILFAKAQEYDSAAKAIEPIALAFAEEPRDPEFAALLTCIPRETLLRHVRLFGVAMAFSGLTVAPLDRLRDARLLESKLSPDADEATRASVVTTTVNALANLGRFDEALPLIERLGASTDSRIQISYHLFHGGVLARMGKYEQALPHWEMIRCLAVAAPTTMAFAANEIAARHARCRGDYASDAAWMAFALDKSVEAANPNCYALTLAEAIFAAWLRDDRAEYAELVRRLNELRNPATLPGTRLFRDCANGNIDDLSPDLARPQLQTSAYLVALRFVQGDRARAVALHAVDAANRANEPFLKTLAHVALAYVDERDAARALRSAALHAQAVESLPLHAAIAQLQGGTTPAMFVPMRSVLLGQVAPDRVRLLVLHGTLHRGGVRLVPTKREMEVLGYLAFRGRTVSRDELADAIFPDATSREADGALRVTISRVRKKFGDCIILSVPGGYAIGDTVDVDIGTIRARVERCTAAGKPHGSDLAELIRDRSELRDALDAPAFAYEWSSELESAMVSLLDRVECLLNGAFAQQI